MPKKVTSIFNSLFSKSRSGKLVTDAAPLDDEEDNWDGQQTNHHSSEIASASVSSTNDTTTPSRGSSSVRTEIVKYEQDINSSSETNASNSAMSPIPMTNNTVAVHNTQAQNVYQFSQISGLHIGTVFNIANTLDTPTVDKRPKSGEPIRKTKSIDGE